MSEPLPSPDFDLTADDLRRFDWQTRLAHHPRRDCRSYYEVFAPGVQEYESAGDDLGRRVYWFLGIVASFQPNYDAIGNPYSSSRTYPDGTRLWTAEDLTDKDIKALREILEEISDPEFRARVGDILWECRRDYKAAQIAVRAFLESAALHKTDDLWPPYAERLERAVQLAARLGPGKPLHQEMVAAIEALIEEFEGDLKSGLLSHRLMRIALEHGVSDFEKYAGLAEKWATELAAHRESDFSHRYWELAMRWHRKGKNEEEARRCSLSAAEGRIEAVTESLKENKLGFGSAAFWMGKALEELRQAKADPSRIQEIHKRFLELQQKSLGEMRAVDLDLGQDYLEFEKKAQEAAENFVRGYGFEDVIARFAQIIRPTDVATLRQEMEKNDDGLIWDKIVTVVARDATGKVSDILAPAGLSAEDDHEAGAHKRMVQLASRVHWPLAVTWRIEPARVAILSEHGIRLRDLAFLIVDNPFIPPGHEGIYIRGLQAGFFGDWLTTMHLLIPQLEASIRYVFQQRGNVVTSTLEGDIQKEKDLNQLLGLPEMEKVFGRDFTFDLRGILIERFGHNMRNEFAHGLMEEERFYQPASVYLWALVLKLCWIGYGLTQRSDSQEGDDEASSPT